MIKRYFLLTGIFSTVLLLSIFSISTSFGDEAPRTGITPINSEIGIEKTIVTMNISSDNSLPWGFVEGKIVNHVPDNPVIIQIYQNNEPVHFAQTDVSEDGSYEYKFRVRDVDNGNITKVFEGDYTVKIFKVVYLESSSNSL